MTSTTRIAVGLLIAAPALGCADDTGTPAQLRLPVLALSEPSLEIGVLEGDEELVFAAIESVIRLPDGRIAVSDGGATRISIFEADGRFVRSWGREGDGPGEFRSLSRIYSLGADSLMAAERHSGRLTVFDLEGQPGRLRSGAEISGDSAFTLDSWLSGRFWVEGALTKDERRRARAILDGIEVPSAWPGYRFALSADDGSLWVREPRAEGGTRSWTRITDDGPTAVVRTPAAFRPTQIRAEEVLGIWSDENGVHLVRTYRPDQAGETALAPAWLTGRAGALVDGGEAGADGEGSGAGPERPGADDGRLTKAELMGEIRSAIKTMASAQEIHYSSHMTYTTAIDSLEAFGRPETIDVDFLRADARGWSGVFSHSSIDRICALAYGFGTPPGWMPGMVLCAPEPGAAAAPGA